MKPAPKNRAGFVLDMSVIWGNGEDPLLDPPEKSNKHYPRIFLAISAEAFASFA